jgi:hypothetical protein
MAQQAAVAPVAIALVGNQPVRTLMGPTAARWLRYMRRIDLLPLIGGEPLVE